MHYDLTLELLVDGPEKEAEAKIEALLQAIRDGQFPGVSLRKDEE